MQRTKIALICFKPNDIYLTFLNKFKNYKVYIIIDDNSIDYNSVFEKNNKYKNLTFIQMNQNICKKYGFTSMNQIGVQKLISGWDKAMCYFSLNFLNSKVNTWFIEDDVFFHNEDVLLNIDAKYSEYDLLANSNFKPAHNLNEWHWPLIKIEIPRPYYEGMMCATRLSPSCLTQIRKYALFYNKLFFLEALIPTLAKNAKLTCCNPDELKTIIYRHDYKEVINGNLYHPIKDISKHEQFRE